MHKFKIGTDWHCDEKQRIVNPVNNAITEGKKLNEIAKNDTNAIRKFTFAEKLS